MDTRFPSQADNWILESGPHSDIVVSSRARLARNLPGHPFAPRASKPQLAEIADAVSRALESSSFFKDYSHLEISELSSQERRFMRESHLISSELEKGRKSSEVYISPDASTSIMVNEEDHLRVQTMLAGQQISRVYEKIDEVEQALEGVLQFVYNSQFGYLAACPTNTGTGLRVSVMVHLVGLVMTNQIEEALGSLGNLGLVVRGAYGENSPHNGDLFQISNEVTLGRTEASLVQVLDQVIGQIVERESQGRETLFSHAPARCEDSIQRAIGTLSHARSIDSEEAVSLLSRIRLGLHRDYGLTISHEQLNRLLIDVQPAHLRRIAAEVSSSEDSDFARAEFLRSKFN